VLQKHYKFIIILTTDRFTSTAVTKMKTVEWHGVSILRHADWSLIVSLWKCLSMRVVVVRSLLEFLVMSVQNRPCIVIVCKNLFLFFSFYFFFAIELTVFFLW